jgi:PAS domain S-box-containing protein
VYSKTVSTAEAVGRSDGLIEVDYRAFFELSADLLCVATETHFVRLGATWEPMLGYSAEELMSRPFVDFVHSDDREATLAEVATMSDGTKSARFHNRYVRKDGGCVHLEWTARATRVGEEVRIYAIARDRSEEESVRSELVRSNRDLEMFAYAASHDLQTPLRKINSFTKLLSDEMRELIESMEPIQRERVQKYLRFVTEGAERSQDLLNGLLSFSRIGRSVERSWIPMDRALDDAIFILDEAVAERGVEICRSPLPYAVADESLMTRVFQNLLGNAIKFRHDGRTSRIEVGAEERADDWRIYVRDNGIGIDARHQDRVFLIFQRIGAKKKGTGLGLALCKKIVESHGGRIWFDSKLGEGTTFSFTIPKEQRSNDDVDDA